MSKQRLIQIESRRRFTKQEFDQIYARLDKRKAAELIPAQIPIGKLAIKVSKNMVTPRFGSHSRLFNLRCLLHYRFLRAGFAARRNFFRIFLGNYGE